MVVLSVREKFFDSPQTEKYEEHNKINKKILLSYGSKF
jgi:hypothetical protein